MLRPNQSALQVLRGDQWLYVFCYAGGRIVTTADRRKALPATYDLAFFAGKFGNDTFRGDR